MNAPLSGGFVPDGARFAVDGDFTQCDPCGLPVFSYPLKGDSILSTADVAYFDSVSGNYFLASLGTFPNIQPWSPNQAAIVLEQEFMVAQEAYKPMRLNTPYNPYWAVGWQGRFPDGVGVNNLNTMYLVNEGTLEDMGGGISKLRRTWASIPPTRNEVEQFTYSYIGFSDSSTGATRHQIPLTVLSRVQYDYFIYDDWNILGIPLFPDGKRLNADTGLNPDGLILNAQYYFTDFNGTLANNFTTQLDDNASSVTPNPTVPSFTDYKGWLTGNATSNGQAADIIAESSTMSRWMGNIFERRTRFVRAQ